MKWCAVWWDGEGGVGMGMIFLDTICYGGMDDGVIIIKDCRWKQPIYHIIEMKLQRQKG